MAAMASAAPTPIQRCASCLLPLLSPQLFVSLVLSPSQTLRFVVYFLNQVFFVWHLFCQGLILCERLLCTLVKPVSVQVQVWNLAFLISRKVVVIRSKLGPILVKGISFVCHVFIVQILSLSVRVNVLFEFSILLTLDELLKCILDGHFLLLTLQDLFLSSLVRFTFVLCRILVFLFALFALIRVFFV